MANDIRYAFRALSRSPLFTFAALLTLALGIGVNSTIFTLADGLLFRGMPGISASSGLVWVSSATRQTARPQGLSFPEYGDLREAARDVFADVLAFHPTALSLGGGRPERIRGQLVTGSYFRVLGVTPALGRLLEEGDDRRGDARAVVVLSYRVWQQRFAGAADVLNRPVTLNGRPFTIVGVAPRGFSGPALGEGGDAWVPIQLWPSLRASERARLDDRGAGWLMVMGRLQPGVAMAGAQAAVTAIAERLERTYPESNRDRLLSVSSAESSLSPQARAEMVPLSALLLAITGLVLLTACANIANLLLARGSARSAELFVRAALGASRGRLVRQLLAESAVLASVGALAALLVSFWGADLLVSYLPADDFRGLGTGTDWRVLAFTGLLGAASVCVFGLIPALSVTRRSLATTVRAAPGGRTRLQGVFVVAQLSLSLVLLLGAGMSVRALQRAASTDLGFDASGVVAASYDLVLQNYAAPRREAFRREVAARVRVLPGVAGVGLANLAPLSGTMIGVQVTAAEQPDASRMSFTNAVGDGYFRTLQIPMVRGRAIDARDAEGSAAVAVVNETLAARLWESADPIGQRVRVGEATLQVVGVARNATYDEPNEDPQPFLYTSIAQHSMLDRETLLVRTSTGTAAVSAALTKIVHDLDHSLPVFDIQALDAAVVQRMDKQRGISLLVAVSGILALLLAALGLFGVMTYAVTCRQREMGMRLALGATPRQVMGLIAADGLRLALAGVGLGSLLALPLAKVLGALVFGVRIDDFAAFAGTCALLVAVALAAAVLPARRAGRLDPITALRVE